MRYPNREKYNAMLTLGRNWIVIVNLVNYSSSKNLQLHYLFFGFFPVVVVVVLEWTGIILSTFDCYHFVIIGFSFLFQVMRTR